VVHEFGENFTSILRIRDYFPFSNYASSWHNTPLYIQEIRNSTLR
jgi:hypothetical protein